ncbi:MAG: hypothetical protein ACRBB3_08155 [Alphaproteobacteria bacterium]
MSNVLLIVNHVQDGYLNQNNPDDVALRQKILDFVEEARPHVDKVAWSYAMKNSPQGLPFNLAKERAETFQSDDATLTNNDGKGLDSNFLQKVYDEKPDHVILVGVYFEACSAATATNIKQNLGVEVSVPMDVTNPAEAPFEDYYNKVTTELDEIGIDVKSTSSELLEQIKSQQAHNQSLDNNQTMTEDNNNTLSQ